MHNFDVRFFEMTAGEEFEEDIVTGILSKKMFEILTC